jgi:long-subunit acyl-CoA synthetase (AMP-forming)
MCVLLGAACAGWPAPGVAVRILPLQIAPPAGAQSAASPQEGGLKTVDAGQEVVEGEVLTRGPHVMLGYLRQPEETARVSRG